MKNSGIYKIENLTNGKVYIGSSTDVYRRRYMHLRDLRRGLHFNNYLQHSWNKYGEECFKFSSLELGIASVDLFKIERDYILKHESYKKEKGYNLSLPNENGSPEFSESTKEVLRKKAFEQHYRGKKITYEEWKAIKEAPKVYCDMSQGKHLYTICIKTGEIINEFKSLAECGTSFGVSYKTIQKVLDLPNRSFKGYRIVSIENYNKNISYIKKNKQGSRISA